MFFYSKRFASKQSMRCAQHVRYVTLTNPPMRACTWIQRYNRSLGEGERIFSTCTLKMCDRTIPIRKNNFSNRLCFLIFRVFRQRCRLLSWTKIQMLSRWSRMKEATSWDHATCLWLRWVWNKKGPHGYLRRVRHWTYQTAAEFCIGDSVYTISRLP